MTGPSGLDDLPRDELSIRELPSPNQDDRPAGEPVDMLILHYTGMQTGQAALDRLDAVNPAINAVVDYRPAEVLARAAAHLGGALTPAEVDRLVTGPLMTRYAKGPEHAYSAGLRAQMLAQARAEHGAAIAAGMAWLERAAPSLNAPSTSAPAPAAPAERA